MTEATTTPASSPLCRAMLREVLEAAGAGEGARKRARRDPNAAVVSEAYPESEYNLNPGAASSGAALDGRCGTRPVQRACAQTRPSTSSLECAPVYNAPPQPCGIIEGVVAIGTAPLANGCHLTRPRVTRSFVCADA